jgi:hypothetical protein
MSISKQIRLIRKIIISKEKIIERNISLPDPSSSSMLKSFKFGSIFGSIRLYKTTNRY